MSTTSPKDLSDDSSNEGGGIPEVVTGSYLQEQPQAPPTEDFYPDDDNNSGEIREYTGVFEGPEKTLEVCFRTLDGSIPSSENGEPTGLRRLPREDLDRICARARCTILSSISNRYLDAYVLSESSLFVYPYMVVLKTCGTTTLLRCIAVLIELGRRLGLGKNLLGRKVIIFDP